MTYANINVGSGYKQLQNTTHRIMTLHHNLGMKTNVFDRIAMVIGKPGQKVQQIDVIKAFRPKFKVSQSTVSKWARGGGMDVDKAVYFAGKYKISGWWLLTGEGSRFPDSQSTSEDDAIREILGNIDPSVKEEILKYAQYRASQ